MKYFPLTSEEVTRRLEAGDRSDELRRHVVFGMIDHVEKQLAARHRVSYKEPENYGAAHIWNTRMAIERSQGWMMMAMNIIFVTSRPRKDLTISSENILYCCLALTAGTSEGLTGVSCQRTLMNDLLA